MTSAVGEKLGPYEILDKLGRGGMGTVYRAWDDRLHREVAIKLLSADRSDPGLHDRFLQEARAASALNHPNICTIFDIGEQRGTPYLVMELLQGQTLKARLQQSQLPLADILQFSHEIADALGAAHARGIVHRDIKPSNILLVQRPNGGVQSKILDFGLARIDSPDGPVGARLPVRTDHASSSGEPIGTMAYMSPEQARGEYLDGRTDLFSLGVTMYEMATRRLPFPGATPALSFVQLLNHAPEPIRNWNAAIGRDLERIILKLLEKDPANRFQTASELASALQSISHSSRTEATGAHPPADRVPNISSLKYGPAATTSCDNAEPQGANLPLLPTFDPAATRRRPSSSTRLPVTPEPCTRPPLTTPPPAPARSDSATAEIDPLLSMLRAATDVKPPPRRTAEVPTAPAAPQKEAPTTPQPTAQAPSREAPPQPSTLASAPALSRSQTVDRRARTPAPLPVPEAIRDREEDAPPFTLRRLRPLALALFLVVACAAALFFYLRIHRASVARAAASAAAKRTDLLAQYAYQLDTAANLPRAAALAQQLAALYPHDPEALGDLAHVQRLSGRFTAALDAAQRSLGADPADPALSREAALSLIALDRYDDALALIQKSSQLPTQLSPSPAPPVIQDDGIALTASYLANNRTLLATSIERASRPPRSPGPMSAYGLYLDDSGQLAAGETLWRATAASLTANSDRTNGDCHPDPELREGEGPASLPSTNRVPHISPLRCGPAATTPPTAASLLAQGALDHALAGDCPAALDLSRTPLTSSQSVPAATFNAGLAAALCANQPLARQAIAALSQDWPQSSAAAYYLADLNAALALSQHNPAAALSSLDPAALTPAPDPAALAPTPSNPTAPDPAPSNLLAPYLRALAHLALHQPQLAIPDLQIVLAHRGASLLSAGDLYPMAQLALARAYAQQSGQPGTAPSTHAAAIDAYKSFLTLWSSADPSNPLIQEATSASH